MNSQPVLFEQSDSLLNRLAAQSDLADPLCSRSEWLFAFHEVFASTRELHLRQTDDSILALAGSTHPTIGPLLEPLEAHWFFSRPLLGPNAVHLLEELLAEPVHKIRRPCVAISGVELDSPLLSRLLRCLAGRYEVGCLDPITFRSAELSGGADGFLSRRTRKFRSNLKRAVQKAKAEGLVFERCTPESDADATATFARMVAVETESWKGIENCGMTEEPYRTFYDAIFKRMSRNGISRAIFARHDGVDIGFVMGGVDGTCYRGQQFSYCANWAEFSVGNLLQWEMIQWLCEQNITRYDMGSILEYKAHWAEVELKSHTLVWRPVR